MPGKIFLKRDQEYYVLFPGIPTYFKPNPFTGSRKMCKYRVISFILSFNPHFSLGFQIRCLKRKYKRLCVPAMNLRLVKLYGLYDL